MKKSDQQNSMGIVVLKMTLGMTAALAISLGAGNAFGTRVLGIDVTSYQGTINWSSVRADGVVFSFAKATEGNYYQDPKFLSYMSHGKAAGLQMGAYDFARPDLITPATEANYFWAFAGGNIIADGKSLFPVIDFETFGGHVGEPSYTAWINAWATDVKAKTSHFLHPVLYASACGGMCDMTTACTLSEWIANFNGQNPYTGNPWGTCDCCNYLAPCTPNGWSYWQFSSTGAISGISGNVDLDVYNGDLAQLIANQGVK